MAIAKVTLIGMTNYLEMENEDLFSRLTLPAEVNKQTLVDTILMTGGEFPVIWANPDFVQRMIGIWSAKMQPTFERWVYTLTRDYNPIHNYDRYEEYTDVENTDGKTSGTNTRKVTGYDSDQLRTNDQVSDESQGSTDRQLKHDAHLYGNIGVVTSATMVSEEIDLRKRFNIYELITEEFLNEFCVRVW